MVQDSNKTESTLIGKSSHLACSRSLTYLLPGAYFYFGRSWELAPWAFRLTCTQWGGMSLWEGSGVRQYNEWAELCMKHLANELKLLNAELSLQRFIHVSVPFHPNLSPILAAWCMLKFSCRKKSVITYSKGLPAYPVELLNISSFRCALSCAKIKPLLCASKWELLIRSTKLLVHDVYNIVQ